MHLEELVAISWMSKKLSIVKLSTVDAECIALKFVAIERICLAKMSVFAAEPSSDLILK